MTQSAFLCTLFNMPNILITNDDGIFSRGISILEKKLKDLGEVYVVAPDRERSTVSHALTLARPLRFETLTENKFSVDGTPADCVNFALSTMYKKKYPDLLISGINHGANLGDDIIYSGTFAAAMEGALNGVKSFAISLASQDFSDINLEFAASCALEISQKLMSSELPERTLLNVNVPKASLVKEKKFTVTSMGKRFYSKEVVEKVDPRGKKYYWLAGELKGSESGETSDCKAVANGQIAITPIKIDCTDYTFLEEMKSWNF